MRPIWWNEAQNHLVDVEPKFIALLEHARACQHNPLTQPWRPFATAATWLLWRSTSVPVTII